MAVFGRVRLGIYQILAELGRELGWIDIDGRMPAEDITAVMIDELEEGGVGCGG